MGEFCPLTQKWSNIKFEIQTQLDSLMNEQSLYKERFYVKKMILLKV